MMREIVAVKGRVECGYYHQKNDLNQDNSTDYNTLTGREGKLVVIKLALWTEQEYGQACKKYYILFRDIYKCRKS